MRKVVIHLVFYMHHLCHLLTFARIIVPDLRTIKEEASETMNAVNAVLQSSSDDLTIFSVGDKDNKYLIAPRGVAVFRVEANYGNVSQTCCARLLDEVNLLEKTTVNVMILVTSDNPVLLATLLDASLKKGVLVWSVRLLVITRLPLTQVQQLYGVLSQTNSILLIIEGIGLHMRFQAYNAQPSDHPDGKTSLVATWTVREGLASNQASFFTPKFNKFSNKPTLRVTLEEFSLLRVKTLDDYESGGVQRIIATGYMLSVLDYLAQGVNFSYIFTRSRDRTWGTKKGATVTGMLGQVYREEVDLGLGPFGMHPSRAEVVDFASPLTIEYASVLAGLGSPEVHLWGFLFPLRREVWAAVMLLFFILPSVETIFSVMFENMENEWIAYIFDLLGAALGEGVTIKRKVLWWWQRVLLGAWVLTMMVLTKSYEGNLMSLLAVRNIRQPFKTLSDVLSDQAVSMIWPSDGILWQYVMDGEAVLFHKIKRAEESGRVQFLDLGSLSSALDTETRRGSKVVVAPDTAIRGLVSQHFTNTGSCAFYILREEFLPRPISLITKRNSPLISGLDTSVLSMVEAGLYDYWYKQAIPNITFCQSPPTKISISTAFSLPSSLAMFMFIGGGYVFSLFVICSELLHFKLYSGMSREIYINNKTSNH